MTHALIDSDILTYRIGFTTQDVSENIAKARMDELVNDILHATQADTFQCYLTAAKDETAFRKQFYPEYKQNRKDFVRPIYYEVLRQHLVDCWDAVVVSTIEADDAISIAARNNNNCVICSIDKDLLQIPGTHYNFVRKEFRTVTADEGMYFFFKQLLTGDKADNVKGIDRIGDVKATKLLLDGDCEEEWFDIVREVYSNDEDMFRQGMALWMLTDHYPIGTIAYRPAWTSLLVEINPELLSSLKQSQGCLEFSTQETNLDGFPANGTNPVETLT